MKGVIVLLGLCKICWGYMDKFMDVDDVLDDTANGRELLQDQPSCPLDYWESVEPECRGIEQRGFKIFQGKKADPVRFPYLASLQLPVNQLQDTAYHPLRYQQQLANCYQHQCGGTFIEQDLILTAAHCIYDHTIDMRNLDGPDEYTGDLQVPLMVAVSPTCGNQMGGGRFRVQRYWISPEYNLYSAEGGGDIAILQIESPADISRLVELQPASDESLFREQEMNIVGWGDVQPLDGRKDVKAMRYGSLLFLNEIECETMLRDAGVERIFDSTKEFCAFDPTTDSCEGDSGGPILVTDFTNAVEGEEVRDVQVGVIGWGPASACSSSNQSYAGVYTRVDFNLEWIEQVKQDSKLTPATPQELKEAATPCMITKAGCVCKDNWLESKPFFIPVRHSGCNNGRGINGNWCKVVPGTCQSPPAGLKSGVLATLPDAEDWDYCKNEC